MLSLLIVGCIHLSLHCMSLEATYWKLHISHSKLRKLGSKYIWGLPRHILLWFDFNRRRLAGIRPWYSVHAIISNSRTILIYFIILINWKEMFGPAWKCWWRRAPHICVDPWTSFTVHTVGTPCAGSLAIFVSI